MKKNKIASPTVSAVLFAAKALLSHCLLHTLLKVLICSVLQELQGTTAAIKALGISSPP